MFSKIVVALNDQPESQRALRTAIDLARVRQCGARDGIHPRRSSRLYVICHRGRSGSPKRNEGRPSALSIAELHERASKLAQELGVHATGAIVEGREVHAILGFLKEVNADLLVIGLHQHDFLSFPSLEFRL